MAVPKRKKSKMRVRQRRAHTLTATVPEVGVCPACGAPVQSHRACPSCGMYRGRKVLTAQA
ncbi:MAG: 50S ribosomal protein L32 [Kiritimatiellia bacterium]|nr:50S ribosomal protein L32 [Kiritimatiellia bacterium]